MNCTKCEKGILGKPLFNYGDKVGFKFIENDEPVIKIGTVEIIDRYGTFEQNEEPSYDILAKFNDVECLFKHIRESSCFIVNE